MYDFKQASKNIFDSMLSSQDKDFIDTMSGVLDGDVSINNMNNIMNYLSNPGGKSKEFNYDWLIDYFHSQAGNDFNFSSITGKLGLDSSKLAQFDKIMGFTQSSIDKLSNLGFGVGDYISNISNEASSLLGSYGSKAASSIRDMGPIGDLFTYSGFLNKQGDPLQQDIRSLLFELAEDYGYILSRKRSKSISRNFHFISKPYLEIDSMGKYHTKVFFTRPNLNLVLMGDDGKYYPHPQLYKYKELSALVESDIELFAELCRDNCRKTNLFPLLSNYCKEIPPVRLNETDRQGIQNKYGFAMPVKGVSNNVGVDVSVTFNDNSNGDISKLFYAWDLYSRAVSKEGYAKRNEYIKYNIIDTAISLYIVVTDSNFNIISFAPAIGLHMSDVPSHFARHSEEGFNKEEILSEFTITFKCFDFSPHDPSYFDAFNRISGFDPSRLVDTRGSARTLFNIPYNDQTRKSYTNDKSMTGGHMPYRTSVFDNDYHGYMGGRDLSTSKTEQAKDSFLNSKSLGEMVINTVSDYANKIGFFKDPSKETQSKEKDSVHFGYYMPYPDVFEHLGRFPGVYATLASESEFLSPLSTEGDDKGGTTKRKIIFKLGWSR